MIRINWITENVKKKRKKRKKEKTIVKLCVVLISGERSHLYIYTYWEAEGGYVCCCVWYCKPPLNDLFRYIFCAINTRIWHHKLKDYFYQIWSYFHAVFFWWPIFLCNWFCSISNLSNTVIVTIINSVFLILKNWGSFWPYGVSIGGNF